MKAAYRLAFPRSRPILLSAGPHSYSSTQIQAPIDVARLAKQLAATIPDKDLAEDGREDDIHVTVLYGIHSDDPGLVRLVVRDFGPVQLRLGKVSIFESKEYDVVKVDVESPDLHALNRILSESLHCTDKHPVYKPHLTIAFVRPGLGQKYVGLDALDGIEWVTNRILFSSKDGKRTLIPISTVKTLATEHAPAGGIVIGGQRFEGGEFIPHQILARASRAEKLAVASSPKTLETRAKVRGEVKQRLGRMIHDNRQVHPIKRTKYEQAMHAVLDQLPPAMVEHIGETVEKVVAYNSCPELTDTLFPDEPGLAGGVWEFETGGQAKSGTLHIDGGHGAEVENQAEHHYAHEIGHAVDLNYRYSSTPEWKEAWDAEINRDETPLSEYAKTDGAEGWSEYIRLIGTGSREYARTMFKRCWAYLEGKGLV